jgi:hypothetical protein
MPLPTPKDIAQDARLLAQERIVDALLRALAIQQPELLDAVRNVLTDTEFTHSGKPAWDETVYQQIKSRLDLAAKFANAHGASQI